MSFKLNSSTEQNFDKYSELDTEMQDSIHFLLNNLNSLSPELIGIAHTVVLYHRFTSTFVEELTKQISQSPQLNSKFNKALRAYKNKN